MSKSLPHWRQTLVVVLACMFAFVLGIVPALAACPTATLCAECVEDTCGGAELVLEQHWVSETQQCGGSCEMPAPIGPRTVACVCGSGGGGTPL